MKLGCLFNRMYFLASAFKVEVNVSYFYVYAASVDVDSKSEEEFTSIEGNQSNAKVSARQLCWPKRILT